MTKNTRNRQSPIEVLEPRLLLASYTLTTLANTGGNPVSGVILSGSTLYGTLENGGTSGRGAVFSLPLTGGTPTILASFTGSNGANPYASLIISGTTLYGTTALGGASNDGTVFSVATTGGKINDLANFNGSNGANPYSSLVLSNNTLYGTTYNGGSGGFGTVFSLPVTGGNPTQLASLPGTTSPADEIFRPYAGLILVGSQLYGTASSNYLVFSVPITGGSVNVLGGGYSDGPLVYYGGNLYAENENGITSIPIGGGNQTTVATFASANAPAFSGLTLINGFLFGTTDGDGTHNKGTIFALQPGPNTLATLAVFNGGNGAYPYTAGVIADSSGNLYGTTDNGTVYKLAAPPSINLSGTSYIELDSTVTGQLDVWNSTANTGNASATYLLSQYGSLSVSGTTGNDTLTVDFARGNPLTTLLPGVQFDLSGTTGGIDSVVVAGDNFGDIYNASAGMMLVSGGTGTAVFSAAVISFSGISSESIHAGSGPDSVSLNGASDVAYVAPPGGIHPVADVQSLAIAVGSVLAFQSPNSARALLEMISSQNGAVWQGQLNLGSNDFLSNGLFLSVAYITSDLITGYSGGKWSGNGIASSAGAEDSTYLTALGIVPDFSSASFDGVVGATSDTLVKYTYYGDANLDGKVDGSDYTRIDSAFATHSGTGWYNGDFNYDGVINGSDYTLIDNAFNTQGASLAAEMAPATRVSKLVSQAVVTTKSPGMFSDSQAQTSSNIAAQIFGDGGDEKINKRLKFTIRRLLL